MKITNKSNLPKVIERAVINDPYDSSGSNISTTRLIAPPRIRVLEMRNWDLIEDDVSNRIFSLLGQSVHHILERSKLKVDLAERRLFYKDDKITNGWTLSGQFDLLSRQGDLTDFKVTSAWAALDALTNGKDEWENQLNVLDFLCRKNQKTLTRYKKEVKVKSLNIMAILRDWSKLKVMQSDNYVQARIKLHQDAEKLDQLPLCTAKERWRKEDSYALMLDNRKTAKRVLPTREEMDKYMKENKYVEGQGCKVVFRAGEDVRCQHYCSVNQFCSHFMNVSF